MGDPFNSYIVFVAGAVQECKFRGAGGGLVWGGGRSAPPPSEPNVKT